MPRSRWPAQNKLNGIFVNFLFHISLFGHFSSLLVFCWYILVSIFLWFFILFYFSSVFLFVIVCVYFLKVVKKVGRKRDGCWGRRKA